MDLLFERAVRPHLPHPPGYGPDTALEMGLDAEVRSRITGVKAQMESFNYYFGISVAELVLKHGDNLSKALQPE